MEAAGATEGILAADSTGVETGRYETAERPDKARHEFVPKRVKRYLKWHVTVMLGLQIILSCRITSNRTTDTVVLETMLNRIAGIKRTILPFSVLTTVPKSSDALFFRTVSPAASAIRDANPSVSMIGTQ